MELSTSKKQTSKNSNTIEKIGTDNKHATNSKVVWHLFKNSIGCINPMLLVISLVSFYLRCDKLDCPREVVFDELHYIKFITLYAKRIFFFDSQPPLGKQLLTLAAYAANFHGDLSYNKIGDSYKPEVPIKLLRSIPCFVGSLVAPLSYIIAKQLNFQEISASLVCILVLLENALHTQSRFILLEPFIIVLSLLSVYCYLRFTKSTSTVSSTSWLLLSSIFSSLAFCIKYSSFYTYLLIVCLTTATWWSKIEGLTVSSFIRRSCIYLICLIVLPVLIYLAVFYVHLSWLTKAGPHDSIMTSAFQASLEGGLGTVTRGQPLKIVHGSQITLRHTHGRSCWLHSHEHVYPIKYADGRGSSHQQQVTCYSFKDTNNWWIVKRPHIDELLVNEPHDIIRDGDIIQLVHGLTARLLNSHDVASAMSLYSQEVSCYIDYNISMPAMDVWRVRLLNPEETSGEWHTITSRLQLVHLNSSSVLRYSGKHLPEWGFHQHEVVADREKNHVDAIWNVEEHRYTKTVNQKDLESQFEEDDSTLQVEPAYSLTFFQKFLEIHHKLFNYQQDIITGHIYACESPLDWIFMNRGIAYWVSNSADDNGQIFLIGNVTISKAGLISILILTVMITFYCLRRQRQIYNDLDEDRWDRLKLQYGVLMSAYIAHLLPYFLYETPLFLQYYLNALVFKILLIGSLVDHLLPVTKDRSYFGTTLFVLLCYKTYTDLRPLTYGSSLTKNQLEALRWKDTWQLLSVTG